MKGLKCEPALSDTLAQLSDPRSMKAQVQATSSVDLINANAQTLD